MKTILVVDDEAPFRSLCRRWLERQGHTVLEASSPAEAIRAGRGADLILLDYNLGDSDAEDVMAMLDADSNAVPVILVSGDRPGPDVINRLEAMGIVRYIEKPVRMDDLQEAVDRAIKVSDDLDRCGEVCRKIDDVVRTGVLSAYERDVA